MTIMKRFQFEINKSLFQLCKTRWMMRIEFPIIGIIGDS
jgi:hypothetical protein